MFILPLNRALLLVVSLLPGSGISANSIYKSVDKNGKISYSSSPTEDHQEVSRINILPPPSEADVKSAQERHQQNLKTDKILDESRQKRLQKNAEKNRIRRERKEQAKIDRKPDETKEQGPYYGIPGHGILVLPKGPRISP